MPGAGTDKTKRWVEQPGPCVILVEPQLADNIGSAARDGEFRAVAVAAGHPRESWPSERAYVMASARTAFWTQFSSTTRSKPRSGPDYVFAQRRARTIRRSPWPMPERRPDCRRENHGGRERRLMFGRERNGLENHEVALADRIITCRQSGLRVAQSRAGRGDRRL